MRFLVKVDPHNSLYIFTLLPLSICLLLLLVENHKTLLPIFFSCRPHGGSMRQSPILVRQAGPVEEFVRNSRLSVVL